MSRNPHSEFLKYHGFESQSIDDISSNDIEMLKADVLEIKMTMQSILQELRKLNT
tara:strand:+ start:5820 stop:5984 length:165 start_codon:yes stop_codon:yes gene_type:complete